MFFNSQAFITGFTQGLFGSALMGVILILGCSHEWNDKDSLLAGFSSALLIFFLMEGIKQFF